MELRATAARARNRAERAWHPIRRHRAAAVVSTLREPSVLFICKGNICRSPFAAGVLRRLRTVDDVQGGTVSSAGFIRPGRRPPESARRAAATRGVRLRRHRSRLVTPESAGGHDLLVVMEPGHARRLRHVSGKVPAPVILLGDLDPETPPRRIIADPVAGPLSVFESCYDRIERCVRSLHGLTSRAPAHG